MKRLVTLLVLAAALLLAPSAFAGPYLNTAAMLLREALQSGDFVRANIGDKELARVGRKMAEARVQVASHIVVPKEVEKAHPHLLLALTNTERAMAAAERGEVSNCLRYLDAARGEARTFRAVLDQLKLKLPETKGCGARAWLEWRGYELDRPRALPA